MNLPSALRAYACITFLVLSSSCTRPLPQKAIHTISSSNVLWVNQKTQHFWSDISIEINFNGDQHGSIQIIHRNVYYCPIGQDKQCIWEYGDYGGLDKVLQSLDGRSVYVCTSSEFFSKRCHIISIDLPSKKWVSQVVPEKSYNSALGIIHVDSETH